MVAPGGSSPTASSTRISPQPAASSTPLATNNAYAFGANNCTAAASGVPTEALGTDKVVVDIPSGWSREPSGYSDTIVLQVDAPAGYADAPTTIVIQSFIGDYSGKTSHDAAVQWVVNHPSSADSNSVADCSVGGGPAAFVRDTRDGHLSYHVFLTRIDNQYNVTRLWGLYVDGTGGLDPNAIVDAKEMLGSWKWGL
jgi:hypothetical protein